MSEEEYFTITNSETQNHQNDFFQTSENEVQCEVISRTTSKKSASDINWMTPSAKSRQSSSTVQSNSVNIEVHNRSSPLALENDYHRDNTFVNNSDDSLSPFSPTTFAENPSFPLTSTGIIPPFPERLMTTFQDVFDESDESMNTTYNRAEQTIDEQTDNNNMSH